MRCPTCGEELTLALERVANVPGTDPLEPVVRRLTAEQYAPPVPEHHNARPAPEGVDTEASE